MKPGFHKTLSDFRAFHLEHICGPTFALLLLMGLYYMCKINLECTVVKVCSFVVDNCIISPKKSVACFPEAVN